MRDVFVKDVSVQKTFKFISIDTDVMYQYREFPTFEIRPTEIDGLSFEGLTCGEALKGVEIAGDARKPVRRVFLKNVQVGSIIPEITIGTWTYSLENEADRMRPVDVRHAEALSFCQLEVGKYGRR